MRFNRGKASIHVDSKGCRECGTEHSSGWVVSERLRIRIGNQNGFLEIYTCADCVKLPMGQRELMVESV